jgi:hypothetical protein
VEVENETINGKAGMDLSQLFLLDEQKTLSVHLSKLDRER